MIKNLFLIIASHENIVLWSIPFRKIYTSVWRGIQDLLAIPDTKTSHGEKPHSTPQWKWEVSTLRFPNSEHRKLVSLGRKPSQVWCQKLDLNRISWTSEDFLSIKLWKELWYCDLLCCPHFSLQLSFFCCSLFWLTIFSVRLPFRLRTADVRVFLEIALFRLFWATVSNMFNMFWLNFCSFASSK